MSHRNSKKIRRMVKKAIITNLNYAIKPKPKWMPKFFYRWIVSQVLVISKQEGDNDKLQT